MDDRQQRQAPQQDAPWTPKEAGPFDGPRTPNIQKPDTSNIIKKLKTVGPDQAKKYRQRTGQ